MRKLVDVEGEGLEGLLGETITLWCMNYIYTGKLVGVNDKFVKLEGTKVVYETGELTDSKWKDAQPMPKKGEWYVMVGAIESFGILK